MKENIKKETYLRSQVVEACTDYFKGDVMAAEVWTNKYALKDKEGNIYELTPDDMHRRLAKEFARIEKLYKNPISEDEIFDLLKNFKYIIPQGSPMAGIGNNFQFTSLSNCFVIGNDADSYGGILKLDQELVQLQKRRAGVGLDLSFVRPEGSTVLNSAMTSTGVVPFMQRYSNSTREVAQDGRRGALMESIIITHPDSEKFIDAKMQEGKVTGANISVKLTDSFMNAALSGQKFKQQYPINSRTPIFEKQIDAQSLWKKIIHNAWKSAEPGILFWDTIIKESLPDCYADLGYKTVSTNPCFPGDEYLLVKNGYFKFKDLAKTKKENIVVCDNRISYENNGKEKSENWKIDNNLNGVVERNASHVFLTKENAEIVEIVTSHGFRLRCTPDHHIATTDGMIEAKDLTTEHEILIAIPNHLQTSIVGNLPETNEEIMATLIGLISGDGTSDKKRDRVHFDFWGEDKQRMKNFVINLIDTLYLQFGDLYGKKGAKLSKYFISEKNNNDKIRISSAWVAKLFNNFKFNYRNKNDVPEFIMNNSTSNIGKFYIAALMYCDGSFQGEKEKGFSIRLSQSNKNMLRKVQMILHSNGMIFGLYKRRDKKQSLLPNGKGGKSLYWTKPQYELISIAGSIVKYRELIGFLGDKSKEEKMMVEHNFRIKSSFSDSMIKRNLLENEDVYCIKEDVGRNIIVNGISTRRCGEIPLCPDDSCRLLSINLYSYVINPFTKNAYFDFELFSSHVNIAQRMMDDMIDLELEKIDSILLKIENDPESENIKRTEKELWLQIKDKAERGRRCGLGITAEGDMIAALGLTYGNNDAIDFSEKVHKALKLEAYRSSVNLAKERGAFKIWDASREVNNPFINRIKQEDEILYNDMMIYGRRNIALLTIAPTGTVSMMTQTTSGIEPVFLPSYKRRRKINPQEKNPKIDFRDKQGDAWQEYQVFHLQFEKWLEVNGYNVEEVKLMPTLEVDEIIKKSPYYKATSADVDWVKKVEMQGRIQKHVDHSISVTVNLPSDVSEELVAKVYETGWKVGCKGLTVYRDGCRDGVLISGKEEKEVKKVVENNATKRPKVVNADVFTFQNNYEKWIAIVGKVAPFEGHEEIPYELFTGRLESFQIPSYVEKGQVIKRKVKDAEGKDVSVYDFKYIDKDGYPVEMAGLSRSFREEFWNYAKLISAILRHRMPMVYVLNVISGLKLQGDSLNTWKSGVERVLRKYIANGTESHDTCELCGAKLIYIEGCLKCSGCGQYSKCG